VDWQLKEVRLAGRSLVCDTFIGSVLSFPDWQIAKFNPGDLEYPEVRVTSKWAATHCQPAIKGLAISGHIIRAVPKVTLRTLGSQIRVKFRLIGDGALYLFSRGAVNDPGTVACCVQKDSYS
jgi:hypothetical protein